MATSDAGRYPGFAGVEYAHVRHAVYPSFDWRTFEQPSPRHRLERSPEAARVALVATAGACHYCAGAFDVREELERRDFPLLREHKGHPSIRGYVADGYEIITF